ncbi:MAG TPA: hypothetical protein VGP72_00625 [Planctomycetota bacterium]|jgi:hypothetical protein
MPIDLEYAVGLARRETESHAIKAHRRRRQNPAIDISMRSGVIVWTVVGLQRGEVEAAERDDVDHLDLYVFRHEFILLRPQLPLPTVAPTGTHLPRTYPWGREAPGKRMIQPGAPNARFPIQGATMRFADAHFRAITQGDAFINIDFEIAPYPHPLRASREQVHFGVDAQWNARRDSRIRHSFAEIEMSPQQYAGLYDSLMAV